MGDVIHNLSNADFTAYTYNHIFTTASSTVVLNGTSITIAPPLKLDIKIKSCTSGTPANVFLIGMRRSYDGTQNVDIKTGLPFING